MVAFLDFNKATWDSTGTVGRWLYRVGAMIVLLATVGTICYSRVFLGAHGIDQIFFGLQLGLWFAFTFHFIVQEPLMELA